MHRIINSACSRAQRALKPTSQAEELTNNTVHVYIFIKTHVVNAKNMLEGWCACMQHVSIPYSLKFSRKASK